MLVRAASCPKCAPSRGSGDLHSRWEPTPVKNSSPCCSYDLLQKTCLIATEQIKAALRCHCFCIMTNSQNVDGNTHILLQIFFAITLQNKHCLLCTRLCVRLRCVSAKKAKLTPLLSDNCQQKATTSSRSEQTLPLSSYDLKVPYSFDLFKLYYHRAR